MLYDWLKEKPQVRGPLLTQWQQCFNDPDFDVSCSNGLREIVAAGLPVNDAIAWLHKVWAFNWLSNYREGKHTQYMKQFNWWINKRWVTSKFMNYVYTYAQQTDSINNFEQWYIRLSNWQKDINNIAQVITYDVFAKKLTDAIFSANDSYSRNFLDWETFVGTCLYKLVGVSTLEVDSYDLYYLFDKCTVECVKHICNSRRVKDTVQIIKDAGEQPVFKSINQITAAHEARILAEEEQLKKAASGIVYKYEPAFKALVEKYGYFLPPTEQALIVRGQQHHNCVGQYAERHCKSSYSTISTVLRLIMSKEVTVELNIKIMHNEPYACIIEQHKGRHNQNKPVPPELLQLCREISCLKASDLEVQRIRTC